MRPLFLDQPYFSQRAPRVDQTMADYASPISWQPTDRSWLLSDVCIALILLCVLGAIAVGVIA